MIVGSTLPHAAIQRVLPLFANGFLAYGFWQNDHRVDTPHFRITKFSFWVNFYDQKYGQKCSKIPIFRIIRNQVWDEPFQLGTWVEYIVTD